MTRTSRPLSASLVKLLARASVFDAAPEGSMLNNWFTRSALLQAEAPNVTVFLDWSESRYSCRKGSTDGDPMRDFFVPELLPKGVESAAGRDLSRCIRHDHFATAGRNQRYALALEAWVRQEPRQEERLLRAAAAQRAMYGAVCPLLQRLWGALHPDITAQADALVGALPQEPWVALHVRGGDKVTEYAYAPGRSKSDHSLLDGMRALAVRHPAARGRTCVIMGDDPVLGQRVQAHAREVLNCSSFHDRLPALGSGGNAVQGHNQKRFNSAAVEQRCNSTRAFLTDLGIMARAPYLVANMASNVVSVAFWVRGCVMHHALDTLLDGDGIEEGVVWF
ncbi:hypothetical protein HYH03_012054 [Edaphochlamys debaryana]|uniref:Uncharacterized protein n=1 Tax=Edaphochlamys debaryana TaxID=47281 RepID=A0A836BUH5_9CHLO|nr:hypothetical protein HYH03_012054 [Edaphochlamys debaryana]|eukprot:KAG2489415.1 hypothetical protein HYH03_012054 [Edaphochlamys debaryana]